MVKTINTKRLKKNKTIFLFVLFSIISIIIIGLIVAMLYVRNTDTPIDRAKIKDSARSLLEKGNTEEAIKLYDNAIALTSDVKLKDALLGDKFIVYYNSSDYKRAAEVADIYSNLDKSSSIEEYIAETYVEMGRKDKAITHYERAIQYIKSDSPMAKADGEYYQNKINLLKE